MARKFTFRGKSLEELKAMTVDQFTSLLTSRARRALKRSTPEFRKLLEKIKKAKEQKGKVVKTHVRDAVILPDWVGLTFGIHNGKEFKSIEIKEDMIGHRLGEMVHTTGRVAHSGPGVGATRGSKFIPLK